MDLLYGGAVVVGFRSISGVAVDDPEPRKNPGWSPDSAPSRLASVATWKNFPESIFPSTFRFNLVMSNFSGWKILSRAWSKSSPP